MILNQKIKQLRNIFSVMAVFALAVFGFVFSAGLASANVSGAFTSQIKDTGQSIASWGNVSWTTVQPSAATQIVLKARTSNSATMSGAPAFSACTALATIASANAAGSAAMGGNSCVVALDRYIQYEATFSTTDNAVTPTLSDVTFNYTGTANYPTSRWLISSKYNADLGMNDNRLSSITWSETKPANTAVEFQVRTASSAINLDSAPWCGPDDGVLGSCNSSTHFTINTGQTIDDVNRDGTNDQWIQYKVFLTSNGANTPVLNDVSLGYTNNLTGNFVSSSYNTEKAYNMPSQLIWNETIPADITNNQSIRVQIATSPDNVTWTSFLGPGNNTSTYYDASNSAGALCGSATPNCCSKSGQIVTCNIPQISISDGYSDQWIKYKVYFDATSGNKTASPSLTSFTFKYDQNTVPTVVATPAPSQLTSGADIGKVSVGYNISDTEQSAVNVSILADIGITLNQVLSPDTTGGTILVSGDITPLPASGTIQVENEQITYTGKGSGSLTGATRAASSTKYAGHASGLAVWIKGTSITSTGDTVTNGNIVLTGISNNSGSPTPKTALWDIKTDLPGIYSVSVKIRVSANDGQIGNPVGTGDSSVFTLDTKLPTYTSYASKINTNSASAITNNISATAGQTATYMRFSNSNISALSCTDTSTAWEAYAGTKNWTLVPDANGVSTVYWQFKDDYCNMISGVSATPSIPANMKITDISAVPTAKYRDIIWWDVVPDPGSFTGYNVYRCSQATGDLVTKCDNIANYSLLSTIASRTTNYCFDEGDGNCTEGTNGALVSTTKYFYKVTSEDADGISGYSAVVSAIPDGSVLGESNIDTTAPVFTVTPATNDLTETSVRITWSTDEASYSLIKYGTNQNNLNLIAGNATESVLPHSVTLSNLTAGTLYYYQVLSADNAGNLMAKPPNPPTDLYFFTTISDSTAPSIVGIPSVIAGQTSATISWATNEASSSQVKYIAALDNTTDPSGGTATTVQSELVTNHIVIITGLTADTIYNYQVISADVSSNSMTYQSVSPFSQFNTATTADVNAPTLDVAPADTGTTQTTTTITWTTNENSYSIVKYGTNQNNLNLTAGSVVIADPSVSHSVDISSLTPGTLYYYQIFSADTAGNLLRSPIAPPIGLYTFTTVSDTTAPSLVGTPAVVRGRDSATISWVTDEASTTRLKYVVAVDNTTVPVTLTPLQSELVTNHFVILEGLTSSTTYNFQVISADASSNTLTSPSVSPYLQFNTDFDKADSTNPVITFTEATQGPAVVNTHLEGATIVPNLSDSAASATFSANENAFFSIIYEASSTLPASYSKETGYPSLITTPSTYAVTMSGLTPNTKYYYKLRARDLFGNTGESVPYYFTTTSDTTNPAISSAVTSSIASTSAAITWTSSEPAKTRIEYSSTIAADCVAATYSSSTAITANYDTDQSVSILSLTAATKYCYRIYLEDAASNSATYDNSGAGYTFTTSPQIPVITNIQCNGVAATAACIGSSATITWTTDIASSSLIDFGPDIRYGTTQGSVSALATSHTVILVGLTPDAMYKYRIKSIDALGNTVTSDNSGLGYTFTLNSIVASGAVPSITSVSASSILANSAVIYWTTAGVSSDSLVGYGVTASSYKFEAGSSAKVTSHTVSLTGLSPNTTYYYRVQSRTAVNQLDTKDNSGAGYTFTTADGSDIVPPVISDISVASITSNAAKVTWTTDKASSSLVDFGTAAGVYTSTQGNPSDTATALHTVELKSLTPSTSAATVTYYFRVRSTDAFGNTATAVGIPFATTDGAAVDCPAQIVSCRSCSVADAADTAAPKITDIKITDITFNTASISWITDEDSNSMVAYDTVSEGVKKVFDYSSGQADDAVKSHKVTLRNLDSNTPYFFRVSSADQKGNVAKSDQQTFTTISITQAKDKGSATAESLKKQFEDIAKTLVKQNIATEENIKDIISRIANPPVMGQEGPVVKDIMAYGATIAWQTDRKANSIVKFTVFNEKDKPLAVGDSWRQVGKMDTFDTKHEVSLLGLAPSTSYSFQAFSQDVLGNTASSEIKTFTTSSSSSIFNVSITDPGLTSATVNWETANLSTTSLEWGLEATYGNYKDKGDEKVKKHSITLDNLSSGATYHYRVRSVEEAGAILTSDDYTFTTPELPQITKYALGDVKDNTITLAWTSNIPIDANVRYTNKENNETKVQGREERTVDHNLTLAALEAGKTYSIEIQGRDQAGNLATVPAFDVQTGMDTVPPEVSQVRSQSAIISGGEEKVQTIISWKTNELASTQIVWDLGATKGDKFANETKADTNLTTNHIAVITQFKPGTVYRYRVISTDKFGNAAASPDYTILTPVKRQSIIQMIVNQFESIFGWVSKIGG